MILKKNTKAAKAVSFETGFQNVPTAFAFLMISYKGPVVGEMVPPLIFAGLFGFFELIVVVIVYRLAKLGVPGRKMIPENAEETEKVETFPENSAEGEKVVT